MKRTYNIKAHWDADAKVFYSESDIEGLHIEADTLEKFEMVMREHAIELIVANHLQAENLENRPLSETIPVILWERPTVPAAA